MRCTKCGQDKEVIKMWTETICMTCHFPPNQTKCRNCGAPSEKHFCPDCYDRIMADSWRQVCPPLFLYTETARLPQEQLKMVMCWAFGPHGLVLSGPPGKGKTRCAIELMKRLHWEGLPLALTSGFQFAADCGRGLFDGSWYDQLDALMHVSVLFIDDLDKCKMTETVETQLFGLIDYRTTHLRPIITTLNSSKGELESRFSDVRGGPIIRRLSEFSTTVKF